MPDHNRFLEGPFAPVTEEVTAVDLPVTGQVPAALNGRYLRNGPNPMGLEDPAYHWFLGDGMVHGVRLREGRAEWYRNRWVRSQAVAQARGETWPAGPVHEGDGFRGQHARDRQRRADPGHGGSPGPLPYELTDELDTVGPCDFGGSLPGGFAAHTKADPLTGDLHAIAYFWAWDHVQHVVVDPGGPGDVGDQHPARRRADDARFRAHRPLRGPVRPAGHVQHGAVSAGKKLPYTWNPAHPARVGLLPRDGSPGDIRWFEVDPCWVFHTLNAYDDDGGRVVMDLCRYQGAYDVSTLDGRGPLTLDRWIVDPAAGKVTQQRLDDRLQEFPRVDDRVISRQHRYGYSAVIGEVSRGTVAAERGLRRPGLRQRTAQARPGRRQHRGARVRPRRDRGRGRLRRPPPPAPARTTGTSWPSCTTRTAARPTWSSWPPRTSPASPWPGCTCLPGSRSGSTAAGSRPLVSGAWSRPAGDWTPGQRR